MAFLRTQPSRYVQQTVDWLREEYPASVDSMLPELRKIYAERREADERSLRARRCSL